MANNIYTVKVTLDKERRMSFSLNAQATIYEETGYNPFMEDFMDKVKDNLNPVLLRDIIWATLLDEDPDLDKKTVGKYITPGNINELADKLNEAFDAGVGEAKEGQKKGREAEGQDSPNPPTSGQ